MFQVHYFGCMVEEHLHIYAKFLYILIVLIILKILFADDVIIMLLYEYECRECSVFAKSQL